LIKAAKVGGKNVKITSPSRFLASLVPFKASEKKSDKLKDVPNREVVNPKKANQVPKIIIGDPGRSKLRGSMRDCPKSLASPRLSGPFIGTIPLINRSHKM
jgi:hypothetical protein